MNNQNLVKNKQHKWSEEEKEYLKKIVTNNGYKTITSLMNEKFEYQFSEGQIRGAIRRYKLNTGLTGHFKKGSIPWNKGKKGINYEGSKATQFKKGHIPFNKKPIGSERVDTEGYTLIKIAEPDVYELKHRVIWEKHYGEIPKGSAVIFKDRNKQNLDIDNLILVDRKELLVLNNYGLITDNKELTQAGVNLSKVIVKTHELKKK